VLNVVASQLNSVNPTTAQSSGRRVDVADRLAQAESRPERPQSVPMREPTVPSPAQAESQAQAWQSAASGASGYDRPSQPAERAMAAYQGVAQSERRAEVAALFGVDLYV